MTSPGSKRRSHKIGERAKKEKRRSGEEESGEKEKIESRKEEEVSPVCLLLLFFLLSFFLVLGFSDSILRIAFFLRFRFLLESMSMPKKKMASGGGTGKEMVSPFLGF